MYSVPCDKNTYVIYLGRRKLTSIHTHIHIQSLFTCVDSQEYYVVHTYSDVHSGRHFVRQVVYTFHLQILVNIAKRYDF